MAWHKCCTPSLILSDLSTTPVRVNTKLSVEVPRLRFCGIRKPVLRCTRRDVLLKFSSGLVWSGSAAYPYIRVWASIRGGAETTATISRHGRRGSRLLVSRGWTPTHPMLRTLERRQFYCLAILYKPMLSLRRTTARTGVSDLGFNGRLRVTSRGPNSKSQDVRFILM